MPLNFTGYLYTDTTGMSNAEQTSSAAGTWTIDASATSSSISVSDGTDPNVFAGDHSGDTPTDATQTYNGEIIFWETVNTYTGSDGNTYTAVVFEYDADGDGIIDGAPSGADEEAYFMGFIPNGFDPSTVTLDSLGNGPGGLPPGTVPPPGVTLTFTGVVTNASALTIVCLASDSLVETPAGKRRIGDISTGDVVETQNGPKTISWIGRQKISRQQLDANPKLLPIRITQGSLGFGLPERDLLVSRQHRMMVSSPVVERMFGTKDILVPAIQLSKLPGIYIDETVEEVEYNHLMFDSHEIVFAEGAPTESLYPGPETLTSVPAAARLEILTIFPQLLEHDVVVKSAHPIPQARRLNTLMRRHLENGQPLLRFPTVAVPDEVKSRVTHRVSGI